MSGQEAIECRAFGVLSVRVGGVQVDIGGPKQRLVLAVLLCRSGAVVGVDHLIDALWGDDPPRTARKNVQVYVYKLRKIFGSRLTRSGRGYRLRLGPGECDLVRFEELADAGGSALRDGDHRAGAWLLGQCLELWREPPLAEFAGEECLVAEVERLTERFLTVLEEWAELELERGEPGAVLYRLAGFAGGYPLREHLAAVWMRTLAAAGRVGEALLHFEQVRRALAHELGIDPSQPLVELHQRLLRGSSVGPQPPVWAARVPAVGHRTLYQLPRDLPDFVGRRSETEDIAETFADPHGQDVVVVSGQVGVGKTAFALHVAHILGTSFPDGEIFVELGTPDGQLKSSTAVFDELMRVIGLADRAAPAAVHVQAMWRSWLAERRLLLVVDSAVREDVVRALMPGGGGSRVIVTSRYRLSGLESVKRIDLEPLTEAESLELLGRIIGRGRVLSDPRAAQEIAALCAGLPLAVRVTGARLSVLRHVGLAHYVARVRAAPVFDGMVAGDLDLRARYAQFVDGLSALQRAAYRRLVALAPPPFSQEAVLTAFAGLDRSAESVLEQLLECNLLSVPDFEVSAHGTYYGMPLFGYLFGREL